MSDSWADRSWCGDCGEVRVADTEMRRGCGLICAWCWSSGIDAQATAHAALVAISTAVVLVMMAEAARDADGCRNGRFDGEVYVELRDDGSRFHILPTLLSALGVPR